MKYSFLSIVIIIILILVMYWRNNKARSSQTYRRVEKDTRVKEAHTEITLDDRPDLPVPFGYKCQWMAVRSTDSEAITKRLNLTDKRRANWKTGIRAAYQDLIFISPPMNGWTLIIGSSLPDLSEDQNSSNSITSHVVSLSQVFGEAQYFGNHRIVGYYAWMKATDGEVTRAFAYLGERGEILVNEGASTKNEQELQLVYRETDSEANEDETRFPDVEDVLAIAKAWGVDPMMEGESYSPGTGYVGRVQLL